VLDLLSSLVDRSLVVAQPGGRYHLLETVRDLALTELGTLAVLLGDAERGAALHEEALAIARSVGSRASLAHTYNRMGLSARLRGDPDGARALGTWALELYRELGAAGGVVVSLSDLGCTAEVGDDPDAAERHHREALELALSTPGERASAPLALEGLAGVPRPAGGPSRRRCCSGPPTRHDPGGGSHLPGPNASTSTGPRTGPGRSGAPRFAEAFRRGAAVRVEPAAALEEAGVPQP
jgi:tetratricopeptide (TPR) repeat protein